ncbi:heme peroxidase [Streptomyces dangxiongensis]|uniref:Heme peroxidase n=1 Tax=Streptomyces dangxiongensis TaxID=1442032 RepID=A0A3G2J6Z2_9ACTN|nr:peroxidase family protein [Streptomyces dangxiongensis]AYN37996.1 heme peroxidase [Streptomyces dangxiongensis]
MTVTSRSARARSVPRTGARDRSRDGVRNRFETHLLTHFAPAWQASRHSRWLHRRLNSTLVDLAVRKAPPRPNPLSTKAPYTSWDSLTDRSWVGRHLPPVTAVPKGLPAPERVAELFRREGEGRCCARSTALLPAFAQWFTDGFLRGHAATGDPRRTDSPHTLDMSQLYGDREEVTACLRTFEGGRMKSRIIGGAEFPPALCEGGRITEEFRAIRPVRFEEVPESYVDALFAWGGERAHAHIGPMAMNVLFLREHNRVAGILADAHPDWDDERVFQTTRNTLIVMMIRVMLEEYINHITPYHFAFVLDPVRTDRGAWHRENWATIEFSLVYRWHSLVPSTYDLGGRAVPLERTVANGQLVLDRGLGPLFEDLSRQPAGRVGLFNTDELLLPLEAHSVAVGRDLLLASYNDYRAYYGFPRVTDPRQISGDPRIQEALLDVYGDVDAIDLYVGLFAEEPEPGAVFGRLLERVISVDAFSEALNNPLLAPRLFTPDTFSPEGLRIVRETRGLSDLLHRNLPEDRTRYFVSLGRSAADTRSPAR